MHLQILLAALIAGAAYADNCFRSAVFEHLRIGRDLAINYTDPLQYVRPNLEIYKQVAQTARQNGAKILVFGEESIMQQSESTNSSISDRQATRQLCEGLPDVSNTTSVNFCAFPDYDKYPISTTLSCLAQDTGLWIVAQMCDVQPCVREFDPNCPEDSQYMYNTQVRRHTDLADY